MKSIDITELYTRRMIVFLEDEPQSNLYRQICLNAEEYKAISDIAFQPTGQVNEDGLEMGFLEETEELYELPDLPDIYEKVRI